MKRAFPLVLCYHAASATWRHALSTPAATIEAQVARLLRLRWRAVGIDDVAVARGRVFHVTFDDAFRSLTRALPALERLRVPVTIFVCTALADAGAPLAIPELAREPREEVLTLVWDELEELAGRGVALESHALTHPRLPELSDDELRSELVDSKQQLEDRLRRACRYVAYPYGDNDARVRRAAERAGYTAAFGVPGRQVPLERFALPRVGVFRDDRLPFVVKTSLPARHVEGLVQAGRIRLR